MAALVWRIQHARSKDCISISGECFLVGIAAAATASIRIFFFSCVLFCFEALVPRFFPPTLLDFCTEPERLARDAAVVTAVGTV